MEELRSTEILDKEIQEDARRKAERILRNTDVECEKIKNSVSTRIETVTSEKNEEYKKKTEDFEKNAFSSIPLEKQRRLVSFIDKNVHKALTSYLAGLSLDKKLRLIEKLISRGAFAFNMEGVIVSVNGFPIEEVKKITGKIFGKEKTFVYKNVDKNIVKDGVLLESPDGTVRCHSDFSEVERILCDDFRYELQDSLFDGRLSV